MCEIIKGSTNPKYDGCDYVIKLADERKGTKIRLLQITDMQYIDSCQMRVPDRLRPDEISAWKPENFDALCSNHIRSLVAQTKPDLIFVTGDMVYGSFDDKGTSYKYYCDFMDSLGVPWAPVFGNHDNESYAGVDYQCKLMEDSKNCVFVRGDVYGNGNYTVGVAVGDDVALVLHMLDTNGCNGYDGTDEVRVAKLHKDQLDLMVNNYQCIKTAQGRDITSYVAFHIPTAEYIEAETAKGYLTEDRAAYTIGVDVEAKDGDFGQKNSRLHSVAEVEGDLMDAYTKANISASFVGHWHDINTCINYKGIKWVYGLKTGQYDSHVPGQLGGTLVTLDNGVTEITHVPSLVPYGPNPGLSPIFKGFFAEV